MQDCSHCTETFSPGIATIQHLFGHETEVSSLDHLFCRRSSKFQLSGEGSVAAGPVGRHASAGTDWKMNTEMLTYSRSKGVFAGLTLEGAVVQQDDDSTRAIYGKDMTFRNILSGKVSTPKSADAFIKAVSDAGQQARIAEATEDKK